MKCFISHNRFIIIKYDVLQTFIRVAETYLVVFPDHTQLLFLNTCILRIRSFVLFWFIHLTGIN